MRNKRAANPFHSLFKQVAIPRSAMVGVILVVALIAFEMFNFDTTQYALRSLLGQVSFGTLQWATILAIAFCAIDFAGLSRLFTPERGADEPKEVWYLMGAWLLGATMNAIMTWWAVSLTLLNHPLGNEVLTRDQLLTAVPIFVAVLVWLTRILFIGSLTVAGERLIWGKYRARKSGQQRRASGSQARSQTTVAAQNVRRPPANRRPGAARSPRVRRPVPKPSYSAAPGVAPTQTGAGTSVRTEPAPVRPAGRYAGATGAEQPTRPSLRVGNHAPGGNGPARSRTEPGGPARPQPGRPSRSGSGSYRPGLVLPARRAD